MSGTTSGHNKPVAYFMTHGTKDSVCTWTGQYGWPQLEDFAKVNGCKSPDPTLAEAAFKAALPQPTSTAGVCLISLVARQAIPRDLACSSATTRLRRTDRRVGAERDLEVLLAVLAGSFPSRSTVP